MDSIYDNSKTIGSHFEEKQQVEVLKEDSSIADDSDSQRLDKDNIELSLLIINHKIKSDLYSCNSDSDLIL